MLKGTIVAVFVGKKCLGAFASEDQAYDYLRSGDVTETVRASANVERVVITDRTARLLAHARIVRRPQVFQFPKLKEFSL